MTSLQHNWRRLLSADHSSVTSSDCDRLSDWPQGAGEVDETKCRMDIVDEQIDTLGRALVGLTLCRALPRSQFVPSHG
jgi:hypothetical protein